MITTVIQGIFDSICLNNIDEYLKYGPVVISTYEDCEIPSLPDNVEVIKSIIPEINWYNGLNIFLQCFSTLRGLTKVKSDFVLKVRTNETYSNISKIIQKIKDYPNKIITNNVAFPRSHIQPFHPSDHMICAKTSSIIDMYSITYGWCKMLPNISGPIFIDKFKWMGHLLPEQMLCISYLLSKNINIEKFNDNPNPEEVRNLMKEYYDVVPVEDLGEVIHSINVDGNRVFRKNGEGLYGYSHESIRNIADV